MHVRRVLRRLSRPDRFKHQVRFSSNLLLRSNQHSLGGPPVVFQCRNFSNTAKKKPPIRRVSTFGSSQFGLGKEHVAAFALVLSTTATIAALIIANSQEDDNKLTPEHISFPQRKHLTPRFQTSGVGGSSSMHVGAYSIGEYLTPLELERRYRFDTTTAGTNHIQVIGKGAYGRVVRATTKLEASGAAAKNVAIKVVPRSSMSAEALLHEVEVLKRVRGQDNIIHLLDSFGCGEDWYVVTELCDGGELLDRLVANGPFKESVAKELIRKITEAIQHVHRCGYVHLDIKPENLVFAGTQGTVDKNSTDCRLIDFGMAKELDKVAGKLSMSEGNGGSRVGTMAYWSPEQLASMIGHDGMGLLDDDDCDLVTSDPRACDMFALGVLTYIILLGCHPFDPKGRGAEINIARNVLKGRYRFDVHGERLKISESAEDLIRKLLDPNPATRITSSQVLQHPWITSHSGPEGKTDRLPHSWTRAGFKTKQKTILDYPVGSKDWKRLQPYLTQRSIDCYMEAVLVALTAMGNNMLQDNKNKAPRRKKVRVKREAFNVIDFHKTGRITLDEIERLFEAVGDTDRISLSLNRHVSGTRGSDPATLHRAQAGHDYGLSYEEFTAILARNQIVQRSIDTGSVVFSQGAEPQGVYVLTQGQAQVEYKDPKSGEIIVYATLEPGSMFGETALVQGRKHRSATIRVTEKSKVIFMPKEEFLKTLAKCPALERRVFEVVREQQANRISELIELLKPPSARLLTFPEGHTLFRQGDKATDMYLIKSGIVELVFTAPASRSMGATEMSVRLTQRSPGDLVGTSATTGRSRYSSAKCLTEVEALVISREDLNRLKENEAVFRFYLESQLQWRNEAWQERMADVERGVTEPSLLATIATYHSNTAELKDEKVEAEKKEFEVYTNAIKNMRRKEYEAGRTVFKKGQRPRNFYLIDSGIITVEYTDRDGHVLTVAQLGPGDHFGEQALMEQRKQYIGTTRCITPAVVLQMDKDAFNTLIGDGSNSFARAIKQAMRQRQHRWVKNFLALARAEAATTGREDDYRVERLVLSKDERLFAQNAAADAVYFIHRGAVCLSKQGEAETKQLNPGDTLGLESFRDGAQHAFTAVASRDKTIISKIPRHTLDTMVAEHRYISDTLEKHLLKQVEPMNEVDKRGGKFKRRYSSSPWGRTN